MLAPSSGAAAFPLPLDRYPVAPSHALLDVLSARLELVPFNAVATAIFALAVVHTFVANRFRTLSHRVQEVHDRRRHDRRLPPHPSSLAEALHFLGEVEVIFGLWAVVLVAAIALSYDSSVARGYLTTSVNYTEAMFVVVVMAIAATRPIVELAEWALGRVASLGGGTTTAWWLSILTIGPILGSLITEPAAMTICALLLGRQFFARNPSRRLKYATLGLLFVNISIGGTLTQFAAPPVLMVARPFDWSLAFMAGNFGWKACVAVVVANLVYFSVFRRELAQLSPLDEDTRIADPTTTAELRMPAWVVVAHVAFLAWTVAESHYPVLFIGGFLFFLGFMQATAPYQDPLDLRAPLLVGFFLAGLVTHGALQGWWIAPVLEGLSEGPLFVGAIVLTAFNDNALVTYLATLVPGFDQTLRYAVVAGAVTGGGLTVIANAPNPAGQALLARFFDEGISPLGLLGGALVPTIIAAGCFLLL